MKNNSQGLPAGRARRRATLGLVGGVLGAPWILSSESKAQAAWPLPMCDVPPPDRGHTGIANLDLKSLLNSRSWTI